MSSLVRRLPDSHPKKRELQEKLRNHTTGFKGEQSLDYFFRYLPKDNLHLLHGVRLLHDEYYFQMDTLIVTPSFIMILEIKNMGGHIFLDDKFSQLIRTYEDKREAFPNPIDQVKRQSYHLSQILKKYKYPEIPIIPLVMMTNPSCIIEASPTYKEAFQKVIKSPVLPHKFNEYSRTYHKAILSLRQIKKLLKLLSKLNSSYDPDICELYQIHKKELTKGVLCQDCSQFTMIRMKGTWYCPICKASSTSAHLEALRDYANLISTKISNSECKQYLNLGTRSKTTHLLSSLNLPSTGTTKSRRYHLDHLIKGK